MSTEKEFQRKIYNRIFSIENSWKADSLGKPIDKPGKTGAKGQDAEWKELEENLSAAVASKVCDGYFLIREGRLGRVGVFIKRALRKALKITFGWYLNPIYQKQTTFNGKILNSVSIERKLLRELKEENEQLHNELQLQEKRMTAIGVNVEQARKQIKKLANLPTDNNDFYHDFEEVFRGERAEVRNRLEMYVPIIKELLPSWEYARCTDVGSGRGEWLDILKFNGAKDYVGVDLNERQNKIAESFGHNVVCGDCIEYLSNQLDESIDLITGFQIIEHLWMSDLMMLLQQSFRTLKKGGLVLFETPNPRNVIVASSSFYTDFSHKRPLHPEVMRFWLKWCGFSEVKIIEANTHTHWEEIQFNNDTDVVTEKLLNEINWKLYGPQDYAILAVK